MNITRQKQAEQELAHEAAHDSLTALANRASFNDRLARAQTEHEGRPSNGDVGVLYCDLNGFKPVNDIYGHQAGDEVLLTTAARLRGQVRPQDTVARLGGDEFAIVVPRVPADDLGRLPRRSTQAVTSVPVAGV